MAVCQTCGVESPDDFQFCPRCGAELSRDFVPRQVRKVVTALFCDVTGSTALGEQLDPEVLRGVLSRYFAEIRRIIEGHGGTVEKFIGDAVMAVFGIPRVHEDDALRAVRAAAEIRERLPAVASEVGVELRFRTGVNTGPVLMGEGENIAIGDAINVAARLEQAAAPGEIVIGEETLRLVHDAVEVEELAPLELKGKSEPVGAFRLMGVVGVRERRFATPMVGRENELEHLPVVFNQAVRDRSSRLFTVLGSAGVGKSRLVAEFLAGVDARVVRGRCLSYGDGITYWPVVEILTQLGMLPEGEAAQPIRSLLAETGERVSPEEIAWGFRKLLEQEAQVQPLAVVLDDLHWAEETLLDLVEHVAELSRDAPLLLLCVARPELLDRRPSWGGGKWNATTVLLEPLDAAETEHLLAELGDVPSGLRERIVQVAEGNPLFLEEMIALVRNSAGETVEVPPTIQALLAARLDQLDVAERSVLERGSVEGRTFHRGAVAALADGDGQVDQRLLALVRKELLRPDRTVFVGDDAYRFRHLLIRDAAYDALPKTLRAELHQRFAEWLEQHGEALIELDEILGYHLEQAARYLAELGQPDAELSLTAGERLAAAGRRALRRGDFRATGTLLERSLALTRPHRLDLHLEVELAIATQWPDTQRAAEIADAAAARADALGDESGAALARAIAAQSRLQRGGYSADEAERLAREAVPLLEAAGDDDGLANLWLVLALVANIRSQYEDWAHASEQALKHSRSAGRGVGGTFALSAALVLGPRPAAEALLTLEAASSDSPHPLDLIARAVLLAMLGEIDQAWAVALPSAQRAREIGAGDGSLWLADIAVIAGDAAAAAAYLRSGCEELERTGHMAVLSTYAPKLGRVLCRLGHHDEAERLAGQGRELGEPDDVVTQTIWRQVQALVHSARSEHRDAERLAREAVEFIFRSDSLWQQGDALCDLAEVLAAAGRSEEAISTLHDALDCYERKQVVPLADRVRDRITALEPVAD